MQTRRQLSFAASLLLLVALAWMVSRDVLNPESTLIPRFLAADLPSDCRQVLLVLSSNTPSIHANAWMLERAQTSDAWRPLRGPFLVTLGRNGLAWGVGEHSSPPPTDFPIKREGDGCSPAGIFRIPFAFGIPPSTDASWIKLPYTHLTQDIIGIDDPKSQYYNQVLNARTVERDWDSDERMNRHQKVYRWGAFIAHNPDAIPGGGSCIFLHLWPGPGRSTAGCTAMSEKDLIQTLQWLDPSQNPRLIQALGAW